MHRISRALLAGSAFVLASSAWVAPAAAHISLEQGGTHLSRYGDGEIKAGPCGRAGGTRGTHVYTYEPGQTITVSLVEFVAHPSYFRFAFDADGDDGFKEPASIKPIDPSRKCPIDKGDHCGAADFYNTPAVLPGMDNLNPHLASGTPKYTFTVKLPDVECTNCTLQVIQVMEDNAFHGDYDPTPGVGVEDIYHQCIDLVLKRGASTSDAGNPAPVPGSDPDAGGGTGAGGGNGTGTGTGTIGGGGGGSGNGSDADGGGSSDASADAGSTGCSAAHGSRAPLSFAFGALLALGGAGVLRRIQKRRR